MEFNQYVPIPGFYCQYIVFKEIPEPLYMNVDTDHEELAEGDVGEDVVCLILAT